MSQHVATEPAAAGTGGSGPSLFERVKSDRSLLINGSFVLAFVVLLIVAGTTTDSFFTDDNITNLMKQSVTTGLLALGMLMVILTGGIDLSVGSVVALAGIMAAGLSADLPIPRPASPAASSTACWWRASGWRRSSSRSPR